MSELAAAKIVRSAPPPPRGWGRVLARLGLLGSLYFAQGLPFGFFTQAVPVLLRKQGASLSAIGFTALLTFPWALKFLWAPVVDRRYWPALGRRRSWILPMQLGSAATLFALAALPHATVMPTLMVGMVLLNLFAATQDIATDGLAVEILPANDRGLANGLQVAGYRLGMVIGGGTLLGYYDRLGSRGVFLTMALLTLAMSLPVLALREARPAQAAISAGEPDDARHARHARPRAVHFLRLPGVAPVLALLLLYKSGESLANSMLRPFLSDAGLSLAEIGKIVGTVGFLAGLLGALSGGALVNAVGRRRSLILFGICQAAAVAGYATLAIGHPTKHAIIVACGVEHFTSGLATAALFTAMMDWCRPEHEGTDYTVQASAVVLATGTSAVIAGGLAQAWGYRTTFLIAVAVCLLAVAAAALLFPRRGFGAAPAASTPRA
jgi:MFS transporter, PAT family, beta-lactamase induction signal transducer AmpG